MAEFWEGLGVLDPPAPSQQAQPQQADWWQGLGTLDEAPAQAAPIEAPAEPSPLDTIRANDAAPVEQSSYNNWASRAESSQGLFPELTPAEKIPVDAAAKELAGREQAKQDAIVAEQARRDKIGQWQTEHNSWLENTWPVRTAHRIKEQLEQSLTGTAVTAGSELHIPGAKELRDTLTQGWAADNAAQDYADKQSGAIPALASKATAMLGEVAATGSPTGFLAYATVNSLQQHLTEADAEKLPAAEKYWSAVTHAAIDAASIYYGGKLLGAPLQRLGTAGTEFADTVTGRALEYVNQKYSLSPAAQKLVGVGGGAVSQAILGAGTEAAHYLNDVTMGRKEWNEEELTKTMLAAMPANLAVGALAAWAHGVSGAIADRQRDLPTVAKAIEDAQSVTPEVSAKLTETDRVPSRREFGKATGDYQTSSTHREAFVDELRRANSELNQDADASAETGPVPEIPPAPEQPPAEPAADAPLPDFIKAPEEQGHYDEGGWWVDTTPPAERAAPTEKEVGRLQRDIAKVRRREVLPQSTLDEIQSLDHHEQRYILDEAEQRRKIDNEYLASVRDQYRNVIGSGKSMGFTSARYAKLAGKGADETSVKRYDFIAEQLAEGKNAELASEAQKLGHGDVSSGILPLIAGGAKQFANKTGDEYISRVFDEYQTSKEREAASSRGGAAPADQGAPSERSGDGRGGVESPPSRPQEVPQAEDVAPFALSRESTPPPPAKFENITGKQPDLIPDMWRDALPGQMGLFAIGTNPHVAKGVRKTIDAIGETKEFHDFRRAILNWSARSQQTYQEIDNFTRELQKSVPDKNVREAMANWREAGGDDAVLAQRAAQSKGKLAQGYEAARKLTPEQKALADKYGKNVEDIRQSALAAGINIDERPNYVTHIAASDALRRFFSGKKLNTSVQWAKQRTHETFFHGEQAGVKYQTKDLSDLYAQYAHDVRKAINDKMLVAEMAQGKAGDGRLLVGPPDGMAKRIEDPQQNQSPIFVLPGMSDKTTSDYRDLAQPALHAWAWKAADENGNPVYMKGSLRVHPEVAGHLENILRGSGLRKWMNSPSETALMAVGKAGTKFLLDDFRQTGKATLFGFLSPFHQGTEAQHAALFHHVNVLGVKAPDLLNDPHAMDWAQHSLMLAPDTLSVHQFTEGVGAGGNKNLTPLVLRTAGKLARSAGLPAKVDALTAIADTSDAYQHYLFHEFIPGLKLRTADVLFENNKARYAKELSDGSKSLDDVKYVTAQQVNASYGHLNLTDIGRSPTVQHWMQILLMAPDFTEARVRFGAQGAKGIVDKSGREQLKALAIGAATIWGATRIMNKLLDDDWHLKDHPFEVVVGNRRYGLRNVPEDIYRAFTDTWKYTAGRASPIAKGGLELLTQTNYRGEKTTAGQTITNIIAGMVPITLQPFTRPFSQEGRGSQVSQFEQFISAVGINVYRYSPTSAVYDLARTWKEEHGEEYGITPDKTVYPASKYQQLRYALEDSNDEKAIAEVDKLLASEKTQPYKLTQRVKESLTGEFTGSKKTDLAFRKSLDEHGKQLFDAAKQRQKLLVKRFLTVLAKRREAKQSVPAPSPAPAAAPLAMP